MDFFFVTLNNETIKMEILVSVYILILYEMKIMHTTVLFALISLKW